MIARGVPLGANSAYQAEALNCGSPASAAARPDDDADFDHLYERVLWRLSAELRSDRERSGHLSDIW